jgi:hypothetical protein
MKSDEWFSITQLPDYQFFLGFAIRCSQKSFATKHFGSGSRAFHSLLTDCSLPAGAGRDMLQNKSRDRDSWPSFLNHHNI